MELDLSIVRGDHEGEFGTFGDVPCSDYFMIQDLFESVHISSPLLKSAEIFGTFE